MNVKMTLAQAKALGIVFCRSCGCPPNNHFDHSKKVCAHCPKCKGFVREIVLPGVR